MAKDGFSPRTDRQRDFKKILDSIDKSKSRYDVFCDWLLCSALAFAQVSHFDQKREERYLATIGKYPRKDSGKFAELLAVTTNSFMCGNETNFHDFLGDIYMACGFGSDSQGQFFTPYDVCRATAGMVDQDYKEGRIIKVCDPAVGGGAMLIAAAEQMHRKGVNYQQWAYFEGWDISQNSCCMSMIQFTLLGMPATIVRGDSLSLEVWEVWETPMVGFSLIKERMRSQPDRVVEAERPLPKIVGELDLFGENYG